MRLPLARHRGPTRFAPQARKRSWPKVTTHMLAWLDDPEQRRRTGSILNKGEARNALARAIFFNRLGELRDRTFENQRHRASGLTLVTAAVALWNTVYLDRAVRHLRSTGADVPDERA